MGYAEYLQEMIRPLGVYAAGGFASGEFSSLGDALDAVEAAGEELCRESIPATAEDWGLEQYEKLLPFVPASRGSAERREAITSLIYMPGGCTLEELNRALSGCGIPTIATELGRTDQIRISFPGTIGEPENFDELRLRIESILPCHLEPAYYFLKTDWDCLENGEYTWDMLEAVVTSWNGLESALL